MTEICRKCETTISYVAGAWLATHGGNGCGDCPVEGDHVPRSRKGALVLRVVQPGNRDSTCTPGRELYWRPNSSRYTHEVHEAGLYSPGMVSTEHSREVAAEPVILAELLEIEARRTALLELLNRVRGSSA